MLLVVVNIVVNIISNYFEFNKKQLT